jgi:hypothetical protein
VYGESGAAPLPREYRADGELAAVRHVWLRLQVGESASGAQQQGQQDGGEGVAIRWGDGGFDVEVAMLPQHMAALEPMTEPEKNYRWGKF